MSPEQLDLFQNPLQRAQELKKAGELTQARTLLQRLVHESPDNLSARSMLADIFYRTGHYKEALAQAAEILRRDPKEPRALTVSGNVMLERKQPAAAAEYFSAALEIAPTDYLRLRLAECYLKLGQLVEAKNALDQVEGESQSLAFLLVRFWLFLEQKEQTQARQVFLQATSVAAPDKQIFARQILKFLSLCPITLAVELASLARGRTGQERNPYLIIYEASLSLKLRRPQRAEELLTLLAEVDLTPSLLRERQKLVHRLARYKRLPADS